MTSAINTQRITRPKRKKNTQPEQKNRTAEDPAEYGASEKIVNPPPLSEKNSEEDGGQKIS
ncbi:hypothetical protein N9733_11700 [Akkermansiaceae bacterium]|nr:hypothetical protein [Akkermansiaceae bacterium]